MTYFLGLTSGQMAVLNAIAILGHVSTFGVVPFLLDGKEKRRMAMAAMVVNILVNNVPILLRLAGLMPGNGASTLAGILYFQGMLQMTMGPLVGILIASMLAEIVEAHAVDTGQHVAGMISAAQSFSYKVTGALGTAMAGFGLDVIQFPTGAVSTDVPAGVIFRFGVFYGPVCMVFSVLSMLMLFFYRISRADHE